MTRNTNKTKEFSEKNSKCGSAGIGRQARLRGVCFDVRVQVPSLAPHAHSAEYGWKDG